MHISACFVERRFKMVLKSPVFHQTKKCVPNYCTKWLSPLMVLLQSCPCLLSLYRPAVHWTRKSCITILNCACITHWCLTNTRISWPGTFAVPGNSHVSFVIILMTTLGSGWYCSFIVQISDLSIDLVWMWACEGMNRSVLMSNVTSSRFVIVKMYCMAQY